MQRTADSEFDVAFIDRENNILALIEAKVHPVKNWEAMLAKQLAQFAERVAFILTIDPNGIRLYSPAGENLGEPIVRLDTQKVLQHYDPEFPSKRVFEPYLLTLVEAWLRDLAYHWKSDNPPGADDLEKAGMLERLEGGTTQRLGG